MFFVTIWNIQHSSKQFFVTLWKKHTFVLPYTFSKKFLLEFETPATVRNKFLSHFETKILLFWALHTEINLSLFEISAYIKTYNKKLLYFEINYLIPSTFDLGPTNARSKYQKFFIGDYFMIMIYANKLIFVIMFLSG